MTLAGVALETLVPSQTRRPLDHLHVLDFNSAVKCMRPDFKTMNIT